MITQINNMDVVNSILSDPDIWSAIAPEGVEPFDIRYVPGVIWLLVNDSAGIIAFHPYRDSVKIHPNFPKKYRGKLAYQAVEDACQMMFRSGYVSLYAEIDRSLTHVVRFAKNLGFNFLESGDRDVFIRRKLDS